jgi:lipopolysaccharide transport system ATP-binding protein
MGAITLSHVGKAYKQYASRWARLLDWLLPNKAARYSLKWVLSDISFSVASGEAVGLIGMNGAGKSTLLKMIVGTTAPTKGAITVNGSVAALLELGMGFHPDCTGRENAIMAAQLLGFSGQEIECLMPQIEAFAEIGEYFDLPVRVYSSGMQVRLAFSVATARPPQILIVDEALSVGDAYFQHKSFQRIRDLRKQGTTLLLVSHDKVAIQSICDRVILLDDGVVAAQGEPETVLNFYNALIAQHGKSTVQQTLTNDGVLQTTSGDGRASILQVSLCSPEGELVDVIEVGQAVRLTITLTCHQEIKDLVVGYAIKDRFGQEAYGTNTAYLNFPLQDVRVKEAYAVSFDFVANLGEGHYSITAALHAAHSHFTDNYQWKDLALVFSVVNRSHPAFVGMTYLPPVVGLEHL